MDSERFYFNLSPLGRGVRSVTNGKRRKRRSARTNGRWQRDDTHVGGDVLVDFLTHVGDFTVAPDLRGQRRLYVRVEMFDRAERKRGFLPRFSWDFGNRRDWVTVFRVAGCVEFEL